MASISVPTAVVLVAFIAGLTVMAIYGANGIGIAAVGAFGALITAVMRGVFQPKKEDPK